MFYVRNLFYFLFIQLIDTTPQLNLYFADRISTSESNNDIQHNCLRATYYDTGNKVVYYCMSESSFKFNIQEDDLFPRFTFNELAEQNISSEELYSWSAPIDVIERYQLYLNELSKSLSSEVYYNCTFPRFGPKCEYQFDYHQSLGDIIHDLYKNSNPYESDSLTCYIHLLCNRNPDFGCLDWTEICDGHINCINDGIDEEHCWQLEIKDDCKHNEYRCHNGQCIPWLFFRDGRGFDCSDRSDELLDFGYWIVYGAPNNDDITCVNMFLTSSCLKHRNFFLVKSLLSMKEDDVSDDCWSSLLCSLEIYDQYCTNSNNLEENIKIVEEKCPVKIKIPSVPILFGDIYIFYIKNDLQNLTDGKYWNFYLCSKNSLYEDYFNDISKFSFNDTTCYHYVSWTWMFDKWQRPEGQELFGYYNKILHKYNRFLNDSFEICKKSNMYQCLNSTKCISIYRLMDSIIDCPYDDDEHEDNINNTDLQELFKRKTFQCPGRGNKYVLLMGNREKQCTCYGLGNDICIEDKKFLSHVDYERILFETVCDGFIDSKGQMINGENETDETECSKWPCNNFYTRCDGIWHCINGEDELDCNLLLPLKCSSNEHLCISSHSNQLICLSIEKTNDSVIDCLGGIDEPKICRRKHSIDTINEFRCRNDNSNACIDIEKICNGQQDCLYGDDELICSIKELHGEWDNYCSSDSILNSFNINYYICKSLEFKSSSKRTFSLNDLKSKSNNQITNKKILLNSPLNNINRRCHYGINIKVWLDRIKNLSKAICLCPPTYYGDLCQYQNQRVRLILQFRTTGKSHQTVFAIIVSLIDDDDDQRIIHSYNQLTFFAGRECHEKYYFYLTYSTRPKDRKKTYSVHIDFYDKISLGYRGSLLLPIHFSFLPVHHLALLLAIPSNNDTVTKCSKHKCLNGKCIQYFNNSENLYFCQCHRGWSGKYCNTPHNCTCSFDSLCIGVSSNNRSVCVCPLNRYGPRCLMIDTVCQTNESLKCPNGGKCIPNDEYTPALSNVKFRCICSKGFYGIECQPATKKMNLLFGKDLIVPQTILIHFVEITRAFGIVRTTTSETIPVNKDSIKIDLLHPFNILLTEIPPKNYYLTAIEKIYNKTETIVKTINSSNRCRHINEVLNKNIVKYPVIRRMKYYHIPCETYSSELSCFYDDDNNNICLCYDHGKQRLANCFYFDHYIKSDCYGLSDCENEAECFQEANYCPIKSNCLCPPCFYGFRCQFRTSGFVLSLDGIIGYHIKQQMKIHDQPSIVQISVGLNIIFIIIGLINGILGIITFKNKSVREVGCGMYLLYSSITTILTMIMFGLKYWILLFAQIGMIKNRSFLLFQCYSFDFILKICLYMDQLLNSCVAAERAITTIKAAQFNKKKSRQATKWVVIILLIIVIATNIHDPIFRDLINEENENEQRIWCIVRFSSNLQIYNSAINIIHFFIPFLVNIISSIILIKNKSHQATNVQANRIYKEVLIKQLKEHKNLFIAPIILIILGIPRLIIVFTSKCMNSPNEAWFYLIGYFITFIPTMITSMIFIIPSKLYKKELRKTIAQYSTNMQRRFNPNS